MIKSHAETGGQLPGRQGGGREHTTRVKSGRSVLYHQSGLAWGGMSWVSGGALLRLGCCLPSGELTLEACWKNPVFCDNQSGSGPVFF